MILLISVEYCYLHVEIQILTDFVTFKLAHVGRKTISYSYRKHLVPLFLSTLKCFHHDEIFYRASSCEYPLVVSIQMIFKFFTGLIFRAPPTFEVLGLS